MPTWLSLLLDPVNGIVKTIASFIPNAEERQRAEQQMQALLLQAAVTSESEQRQINKVEAANGSLFVAGWRPAVGWLCVFILAYQIVFVPLFNWVMLATGLTVPPMPIIETDRIYTLLTALLGINIAARSVDKFVPGGATKIISGLFSKKN